MAVLPCHADKEYFLVCFLFRVLVLLPTEQRSHFALGALFCVPLSIPETPFSKNSLGFHLFDGQWESAVCVVSVHAAEESYEVVATLDCVALQRTEDAIMCHILLCASSYHQETEQC